MFLKEYNMNHYQIRKDNLEKNKKKKGFIKFSKTELETIAYSLVVRIGNKHILNNKAVKIT